MRVKRTLTLILAVLMMIMMVTSCASATTTTTAAATTTAITKAATTAAPTTTKAAKMPIIGATIFDYSNNFLSYVRKGIEFNVTGRAELNMTGTLRHTIENRRGRKSDQGIRH